MKDLIIAFLEGKIAPKSRKEKQRLANMTKSKRGGKRKGAGPKPKPISETKPVQKGFRCSSEVGAFLAEVGTGFIEDVIRVSEVFKRWSKGK